MGKAQRCSVLELSLNRTTVQYFQLLWACLSPIEQKSAPHKPSAMYFRASNLCEKHLLEKKIWKQNIKVGLYFLPHRTHWSCCHGIIILLRALE